MEGMVMTIFGTDINALAFAGNNYVFSQWSW